MSSLLALRAKVYRARRCILRCWFSIGKKPVPYELSKSKRFIFVAGLHRSGTSLIYQWLRSHAEVSGFAQTGVQEDEGQHLQDVMPSDEMCGGPGCFAFNPKSRLNEHSAIASDAAKRRLLSKWSRYLDPGKTWWVEKSPPNLVRCRFLQALFVDARFVIIVRHPIPVALATAKWSRRTVAEMVSHWEACHAFLLDDYAHLKNAIVLRYEDIMSEPAVALSQIFDLTGLQLPKPSAIFSDRNAQYFAKWGAATAAKAHLEHMVSLGVLGGIAGQFGYQLMGDPEAMTQPRRLARSPVREQVSDCSNQ
jgi:hypothetical protein